MTMITYLYSAAQPTSHASIFQACPGWPQWKAYQPGCEVLGLQGSSEVSPAWENKGRRCAGGGECQVWAFVFSVALVLLSWLPSLSLWDSYWNKIKLEIRMYCYRVCVWNRDFFLLLKVRVDFRCAPALIIYIFSLSKMTLKDTFLYSLRKLKLQTFILIKQ